MRHRVHPALKSAPSAPFTGPTRRDQGVLRRWYRRHPQPLPTEFVRFAAAIAGHSDLDIERAGPTLGEQRASTMYADPTHVDFANFKGGLGKILRRLGEHMKIKADPVTAKESGQHNVAYAYRGHPEAYFRPDAYSGFRRVPGRRNFGLSVGLHEFAHTKQPPGHLVRTHGHFRPDMETWETEGGAELEASRLAARLGIPYDYAEPYAPYVRQVRRSR